MEKKLCMEKILKLDSLVCILKQYRKSVLLKVWAGPMTWVLLVINLTKASLVTISM